MTFPLGSGTVPDGLPATAIAWWRRFFKPVNDALDVLDADDTGWISPTLTNSWVNFGTPWAGAQYRRVRGVVYLRGLIKSGTTGTAIFTLPAGFIPGQTAVFSGIADTATAAVGAARIDVVPTGTGTATVQVTTYQYTGQNTYLSLSQVKFYAEA